MLPEGTEESAPARAAQRFAEQCAPGKGSNDEGPVPAIANRQSSIAGSALTLFRRTPTRRIDSLGPSDHPSFQNDACRLKGYTTPFPAEASYVRILFGTCLAHARGCTRI